MWDIVAEGMDGLRASLAADPAYEVARQTFVALLLEAKRTNEAATALQEGLGTAHGCSAPGR